MATIPSPRTWTPGEKVTAAMLNGVRDACNFLLNPPSCRVYNTAAQLIPNNTLTPLLADSDRWDTDGIHSTVTNTERLTCVTPGIYDIYAVMAWATNTTGIRETGLWVNNVLLVGVEKETVGADGVVMRSIHAEWKLAVGDYITLQVRQTSGGNLNVTRDNAWSAEWGMTWKGIG